MAGLPDLNTNGGSGDAATDVLINAIQELSLARDMDAVSGVVRRAAREVAQADGVTLVLRDGDYCHYVDEEAIGPLWKGRRFHLNACISGWVMVNGVPAVVPDIYEDPRIPLDVYRPTFVQSLAMAPIRARDPVGAIGTYWARRRAASDQEVRYLQALADATAVAIERVRLYEELEHRVRERTHLLEEANRQLAREMLQERAGGNPGPKGEQRSRHFDVEHNQLAGVLASTVAHELNQPLGAAINYLNTALLLLRGNADSAEKAIAVVEKAAAENWRAVEMVSRFRELLRRGKLDLRPVNLKDVIRSVVQVVRPDVEASGASLQVQVAPDLGPVRCDPLAIEHVVFNLVRNSAQAMSESGIALGAVRVSAEQDRDGLARVTVADDGPGVDPAIRDELFTPFRTTKQSGVGLGLSVCRGIVEAHDGTLWTDTDTDSGATFHFTLPLAGDCGLEAAG